VTSRLSRKLKANGIEVSQVSITANEGAKDYQKLFPLFSRLLQSGMDRNSVLFAVGGGVIGDLAGFVAATYLRGIRWVGIPTTLLAQVDSSIGGKTAVNHPLGKNLIGAFHQPSLVVCDTTILKTLSNRDRLSGFGELIKYGLAFDRRLFETLRNNHRSILQLSPKHLNPAIVAAIKWKTKVVSRDERETRGLRMTLNLGHTLGHAYESITGYRLFRHGEAVILGMRLAAALSVERGHLKEKVQLEIEEFLGALKTPRVPRVSLKKLLGYTARDKKVEAGKVPFVLLSAIGKTVIDRKVSKDDIASALMKINIPVG